MIPYPWETIHRHHNHRWLGGHLRRIAPFLWVPATVLSLGVTFIVGTVARHAYQSRNDSWSRRGLLMMLAGVLMMLFFASPIVWGYAFLDLLYSFGDKATMTTGAAASAVLVSGLPIAFVLHGLATVMLCYEFEHSGDRWRLQTKPTVTSWRRTRRNTRALQRGPSEGAKWLCVGVIVDDPIPWRTPRRGMVVERPARNVGHGLILGGNGTGKTICAVSLMYQFAASGGACLYVDYKASGSTRRKLAAAAAAAGRPFYYWEVGTGSDPLGAFYELLAWEGTSSEKASMITSSLSFREEGDGAHYKNLAEQWLTFQFDVLARVGTREGESHFDFLLATATAHGMQERLAILKSGGAADHEAFEAWMQKVKTVGTRDLAGLRANLENVINAGGDKLRPRDGAPSIDLRKIAEEGAVCYIGLSATINDVAVKTLGSLVLRDLGVLTGERQRALNTTSGSQPEFMVMVDEASRMGHRAVVMDNLFATAREADVDLWVITQSFSTWPSSTLKELTTNASTKIIFRVQDPDTAEEISRGFTKIPALVETTMESVEHREFQGRVSEMNGEARHQMGRQPMIPADTLTSQVELPNQHAYVSFGGSHDRPTRKRWRSRRVRKDHIGHDVPLTRVVVASSIVTEDASTPASDVLEKPATSEPGSAATGTVTADTVSPPSVQDDADAVMPHHEEGDHPEFVPDGLVPTADDAATGPSSGDAPTVVAGGDRDDGGDVGSPPDSGPDTSPGGNTDDPAEVPPPQTVEASTTADNVNDRWY